MRHVSPTLGEAHLPHHVRWKTFSLMLCVSLVGPLPRHALLPLLRPLDAVRSVTQLLKLSSGHGLANGLERFLERFPGPPCAPSRLASQDLVRHVGHPLLLFHGLLLPGSFCSRLYSSAIFLPRSEEHTSELQSRQYLVCRLLLEKK